MKKEILSVAISQMQAYFLLEGTSNCLSRQLGSRLLCFKRRYETIFWLHWVPVLIVVYGWLGPYEPCVEAWNNNRRQVTVYQCV